jgi:hypothetical protein
LQGFKIELSAFGCGFRLTTEFGNTKRTSMNSAVLDPEVENRPEDVASSTDADTSSPVNEFERQMKQKGALWAKIRWQVSEAARLTKDGKLEEAQALFDKEPQPQAPK